MKSWQINIHYNAYWYLAFLFSRFTYPSCRTKLQYLFFAWWYLYFGSPWLVSKQSRYDILKRHFDDLKKVNENEIVNIETKANAYYNGEAFQNEKHFYVSDLDVFGKSSLFQLINRSATSPGNNKLAAWLNTAANKPTVISRQAAVKEIATKNDWRLNFQTALFFSLKQPLSQVKNLVAYLKMPVEIENEQLLSLYSTVAPFLLLLFDSGEYFLSCGRIFYCRGRYF